MKSEVTETELAVLQFLWDGGPLTSSEVAEQLYDEVSDPKRSSAQKLLDRLIYKECVECDRSRRPQKYRAIISRDEFAGRRVQALADRLYEGSLTPVLTSLVQSSHVSKNELAKLRQLIDDLSPPARRKRKNK